MHAQDALFSKTQQRLIGVLFGDEAATGITYAEILRRTAGGAGAIHRELKRFLAAKLIVQRGPDGRAFAANTRHPIYPELHAIAKKLLRLTAPQEQQEHLQRAAAAKLARKYLWWMSPKEAVNEEDKLIAQVMSMGTFEDARLVERQLGKKRLRRVLEQADPGQFDEKSWTYWHYRLDAAKLDHVPPLPQRQFG